MDSTTSPEDLPHDNLQSEAVGLTFGFPVAATIVVLLRVYIRVWMRSFAADDWVISAALVLYWANTVTTYYTIKTKYIGYHSWDIPEDIDPTLGGKWSFATQIIYNPVLVLVRASILLFLLRLTGQRVAVRWTIWGIMIFNVIAGLIATLFTVFNCIPIAVNWNQTEYPNKKCLNFADWVTATSSLMVFADFLVLLLPTWIVYNLHIARKQKIMLVGILSFGLITVLAGIIRVILLDRYDRNIPADANYSVLFCISTIEVGLAFVCACAPALKPVFVLLVPKLFSTSNRSGRYSRGTGSAGRYAYGYDLDPVSRSQKSQGGGHSASVLGGRGDEEGASAIHGTGGGSKRNKNGIMLTTETEVKWAHSPVGSAMGSRRAVNEGSSTESLVQPRI